MKKIKFTIIRVRNKSWLDNAIDREQKRLVRLGWEVTDIDSYTERSAFLTYRKDRRSKKNRLA